MNIEWNAPVAVVEQFVASEYIAACGDSGETVTSYLFNCNAGFTPTSTDAEGFKVFDGIPSTERFDGAVYQETNPGSGLDRNADKFLGDYHPCGAEHESATQDTFYTGYYVPYNRSNAYLWDNAYEVFIWIDSTDNVHCTRKLGNVTTPWYTSKS